MRARDSLGTYWHTLRHLRPVQFYGRLRLRLSRPHADLSAAPPRRNAAGTWQSPARRATRLVGPRTFFLLGKARSLDEVGWDGPDCEKLWRYNQHYFDDLNARDAAGRSGWHQALMLDWMRDNPPVSGTAWEPYPTSLRIVNWVKWALSGNDLPGECIESLAVQCRWLRKRMEWHLLGNHLFANAKALVFGGHYFEGEEARRWLAAGLQVIERQLPEQVLADGGNFERSTMYHAIFLEDLLDLLNLAEAYPGLLEEHHVLQWRQAAARMGKWLRAMTHPDGEIALFNDAAFDVAPSPAELEAYATRLLPLALLAGAAQVPSDCGDPTLSVTNHEDSGYVRLDAPHAVALLDVAPVGPDYLPGHAHADTLSFELSVFRRRLVVNGGTSCYGMGPDRLRERRTASHSTVEVDGQDSSEVWSGFRVARRAYPFGLEIEETPESISVACSHDGYTRLPGRPVHRRVWKLMDGELEIADTLRGGRQQAVARYILHPEVDVEAVSASCFRLTLAGDKQVTLGVCHGRAREETAQYAPSFGKLVPTRCIAVELQQGRAVVSFQWASPTDCSSSDC